MELIRSYNVLLLSFTNRRNKLNLKKIALSNTLPSLLFLMVMALAGCAPASTLPTATNIPGCNEGGSGVFTPEDVQCYLDKLQSNQVQSIDENTAFLLSDATSIGDWVGAAIIYHIPTRSMLVLDKFGDIDPLTSVFTNRAGLAAISELTGDPALMAGLKQQVELNLQTSPSHQPEIRLSAAWQDGQTTIFLITVAGLDPNDERFYCPNQTWILGDITEEIAVDCISIQAGIPISRVFFESKTIQGNSEIPVQVALNGVQSNILQVREGNPARESAIYRAVLEHFSSRPLIIRDETITGYDYSADLESKDIPSSVLQNYLAANQIVSSLRFLFQNSESYFTTPSENITRYFLQGNPDNPQQACEQFHNEYPQLGSVVTLSNIGFSEDGSQALVHILIECGPDDTRRAAYVLLSQIDGKWQVLEEIPATT